LTAGSNICSLAHSKPRKQHLPFGVPVEDCLVRDGRFVSKETTLQPEWFRLADTRDGKSPGLHCQRLTR
jgi:hypothetical protein